MSDSIELGPLRPVLNVKKENNDLKHFAGLAMQAIIQQGEACIEQDFLDIARDSVKYAKALINEIEKENLEIDVKIGVIDCE